MPCGKKKTYQLQKQEKKNLMLTGKYTKNSSKNVTPSSSWSSTSSSSSSKGLIRKNEVPSQVKKSTKLKKCCDRDSL